MTKTGFAFEILVIVICLIFVIWNFFSSSSASLMSFLACCRLPDAGCSPQDPLSPDFLDTDLGRVYKKAIVGSEG
jgi:hypothetical protein